MAEISSPQKIQKLLQTQNTFKRNKRYYDVPKLLDIQRNNQILRRKPLGFSGNNLQKRVNSSFRSSQESLNAKVNLQIGKFKERVSITSNTAYTTSMSFYQDRDFNAAQQLEQSSEGSARQYPKSPPQSPRIKGVPHGSMTSRDYFYKRENKVVSDERLFNNFKIEKPALDHMSSFKNQKNRSLNFEHKHINDLTYNTQKLYQKNNFKRTTESCLFDLKLQKRKPRFFFISRPQGSDPSTDLNPESVKQAFEAASHFTKFKAVDFYQGSGRQLPHQIQIREMSPLKDFWRGNNPLLVRPKLDYIHQKIKEEMKTQRMNGIKNRKKNSVSRNEVCDEKYFKMIHRESEKQPQFDKKQTAGELEHSINNHQ